MSDQAVIDELKNRIKELEDKLSRCSDPQEEERAKEERIKQFAASERAKWERMDYMPGERFNIFLGRWEKLNPRTGEWE